MRVYQITGSVKYTPDLVQCFRYFHTERNGKTDRRIGVDRKDLCLRLSFRQQTDTGN